MSNGSPALMVVRQLDHNLPLHAVAPRRAAGAIPGRVKDALKNLEGFAIWIDEQEVVIMDQETREQLEAPVAYSPSLSDKQLLRKMGTHDVAMRSKIHAQLAEPAEVKVEAAGKVASKLEEDKENRRPSTPISTKPPSLDHQNVEPRMSGPGERKCNTDFCDLTTDMAS